MTLIGIKENCNEIKIQRIDWQGITSEICLFKKVIF